MLWNLIRRNFRRKNPKLISFMYLLMKDRLTTGVVEQLVMDVEKLDSYPIFTNKHLLHYAEELVLRMKG